MDDLGFVHVRFRQTKNGLDVVGGSLSLHVDSTGLVYAAFASARDEEQLPRGPRLTSAEAQARALANRSRDLESGEPRLVYVITSGDQSMHLAWEVRVQGVETEGPVDDLVFVDAVSGDVVDRHPLIVNELERSVMGAVTRIEGDPPTLNEIVDTNYDLLGDTYGYYFASHGRDSYDDEGATMESDVDLPGFNNAYWSQNGEYFTFGDGDGNLFSPLGSDQDIVTHEVTHAVTQYTSNLVYQNECGALNEAFSDIMAAAHDGWAHGVSSGTWLMGESSYTPGNSSDALRYLNNPTQDGVSKDYYPERYLGTADGGGVHWNSGIANLAFYLLSHGGQHPRGKTSVNVPAVGIEHVQQIFYRAFTVYLGALSQMIDARMATVQAAADLYGSTDATRTNLAWDAVGVPALNESTRPINFSTRANVGTGSDVMIMGISLGGGTSAKPLLLRGVGPTLANFGVPGVMADPMMSLFSGSNQIASNDDWSSSPDKQAIAQTAAAVYAFSLYSSSADAAMLVALPPGIFNLFVESVTGSSGVCLLEVYEVTGMIQ